MGRNVNTGDVVKHIFISHAWKYNRAYRTLVAWLDGMAELDWENCSLPSHDGIDGSDVEALRQAITQQIERADVVLIIAGMYYSHSEWITFELNEACRLGKMIVAIAPRGQQRMPGEILDAAECVIRWRRDQVEAAVMGGCL